MDIASIQILDRAEKGGGQNLTEKALAGKEKDAKERIERLCAAGHLTKEKKKYSLTDAGRQAVVAGREQLRDVAVGEFLDAVLAKKGKALTAKELTRFPDELRAEAVEKRLVQPGKKQNSYDLLSAGEAILLARLPVSEQVSRLRELQKAAEKEWEDGLNNVEKSLRGSGGASPGSLGEAVASLRDRVNEFRSVADTLVAELGGITRLAEVSRRVQEQITRAGEEAVRRVEETASRTRGTETASRQSVEELRSSVEASRQKIEAMVTSFEQRAPERRQFEDRIAELEQQVRQAVEAAEQVKALRAQIAELQRKPSTPASAAAKSTGPELSEEAVFQATRTAYSKLHQENLRLGGIVKVPELHDAVRGQVPGLPREAFHALLKEWREKDRLVLQVCNDPDAEPRAGEGIESGKGLLFYVKMG